VKDHGSKKEGHEKGCEKNRPHCCEENREEKTGEEGRKENGKESGEKNREEAGEKSRGSVTGPSADAGGRLKAAGHAQEASAQEKK